MSEELGATEREIVAQRLKKAEQLRQLGVNPYGNGHVPAHLAREIHARYGEAPADQIALDPVESRDNVFPEIDYRVYSPAL